MTNWGEKERRSSPRIVLPCMISITPIEGEEFLVLAHTENISEKGVYIVLQREIPKSAEINLEINLLNSQERVICKGEVVRCEKKTPVKGSSLVFYGLGIVFQKISDEDKSRLRLIVEAVAEGSLKLPEVQF